MKNLYLIICLTVVITGCGKDFLDIKRDSNQVVPNKVRDYLAILNRINMFQTSNHFCFLGSDEYYIKSKEELIAGAYYEPYLKNAYAWSDLIFNENEEFSGWNTAYEKIMYANLALDVEKIKPDNEDLQDWNKVRVAGRFHRAWNYYQLAQQFCEAYDPNTAKNKLGLQLRLDYDVSVHYDRSNLQQVYDLILTDLQEAEEIPLPDIENIYIPGKRAVNALLARVYLQMGDFDASLKHVEKALQEKTELMDYNQIEGELTDYYGSFFEIGGKNNPSIIFYSYFTSFGPLDESRTNVDTVLFNIFDNNDLRKKVYFFKTGDQRTVFTGSYSGEGASRFFTGLSVEEMLLIRAECNARKGNNTLAIDDLNRLRNKRMKKGAFIPIQNTETDLIQEILLERKKELFMRGLRWEDVRRLNREGTYPQSFKRILDGSTITLEPHSKKWVWPIPPTEITRSGIVQNPR